jgi:tetratricopeptide (TPR) repeat protein
MFGYFVPNECGMISTNSKQTQQCCRRAVEKDKTIINMAESPTLQNDPVQKTMREKEFVQEILPIITKLFQNPDVVADYQGGAFFLTKVLYLDQTDLDLDTRSKIRTLYTKFELFMMTKLDPSVTTPEILARFYMHFGDCKLGLKRPEQALKEYDKVEALDDIGDDIKSEIYMKKGNIAVGFNQDDKAQKQFKKAAEIYKNDPEKLVDYIQLNGKIGACLMNLNCFKEAIRFQRKVIHDLPSLVPQRPVTLGHLHERQGRCYAKLKDYSNAEDHFNKASELVKCPQEQMAIKVNIGLCWNQSKNNYKNASKSFRQALEIGLEHKFDQQSLKAASYLATAFDLLHEHKKSIKSLKFVIKFTHELHSNDTKQLVDLYQWRGINHLNVKEYDEALEWFNRSIQPAHVRGFLLLLFSSKARFWFLKVPEAFNFSKCSKAAVLEVMKN